MRHVYIHVPFCRRRCSYCDFSIAVRRDVPGDVYTAAVRAELALLRRDGQWDDAPPETVYFGGGTPSLLEPGSLRAVLQDVLAGSAPAASLEVTLEVNPEDVTPARAAAWRALGVNRISLGAQSFHDPVLVWMHRPHTAARIGAAVRELRAAGFDNLSLDLIFALPAELARDWDRDLDAALALAPEHLSLYGLTVGERTPLARWISRGAASAPADERYAAEYLRAHTRLAAAGYEFYEVSNAARPDRQSRHNRAYWTGRPYAGVGPAAHAYDGRSRRWNVAAWEAYRRRVAAGASPVADTEELGPEQRRLEAAYLGLRTADGVAESSCPPAALAAWAGQGWVTTTAGRARCTAEGWLRLDALVADLTRRAAAT